MTNLALDNKLMATISLLAKRLKTTRENIVKEAVNNYAESINQKDKFMSFAGLLNEEEADDLLHSIYNNRQNKVVEPGI
jgi:hypothetical protein